MKYKNYIIKPNGFGKYDLFEKITAKKKSGEKYETEKNHAWAQTFDSALEYLKTRATDDLEADKIQGYIDDFRQVTEDTNKLKQMK